MMEDKVQEISDMRAELEEKADKIDLLLQHVAKLLAVNTNYATMVSKPQYKHKKIKFIQLSAIDRKQLLVVIVTDGNIVTNRFIHVDEDLNNETVLKLNILFNTFLQGLDLTEINMALIQKMKIQAGEYSSVVGSVLDIVAEVISSVDDMEIYTSGATNILKYPELSDRKKASELLYTFEEKKQLTRLITDTIENNENRGIQVYIGEETPVESMKDCSVVTATYEIEDGVYGKIGIVGPKRMDYEKVVNTLQTLMVELDSIFKRKS